MLDSIISHADLLALVDELARKRSVVGPVSRSVPGCDPPIRYFYEEVDRAAVLDLGFTYCVYSPKRFLLPPSETLFTFERSDGGFKAKPVLDKRPLALVGVHPCDLHALRTLDSLFSQDPADEHYLARRQNTFGWNP